MFFTGLTILVIGGSGPGQQGSEAILFRSNLHLAGCFSKSLRLLWPYVILSCLLNVSQFFVSLAFTDIYSFTYMLNQRDFSQSRENQ